MNKNKFFIVAMAVTLVLSFTLTAVPSWAATKEEIKKQEEIKKEKDDVRKVSRETLNQLYKLQPSAKEAISKAAGYAAFSNFGMKIFVAGSGTGKGIAIECIRWFRLQWLWCPFAWRLLFAGCSGQRSCYDHDVLTHYSRCNGQVGATRLRRTGHRLGAYLDSSDQHPRD